ncbi:TM0106 family RecB-like putative nuclease [Agrococcus versicolor]|uniref:TM0106 family RecB-like putative nuclease n=1 Tax=Agrococcus versicolor TaxID=501482 RepID=A0ABP5MM48_9MICO
MYFMGEALVTSASDLKAASECEYAFLRGLDRKLGRIDDPKPTPDAMLERAGQLGDVHEREWLEHLRTLHAEGVVELPKPADARDADELRALASRTLEALRAGVAVVFQGVFFDESNPTLPFVGFADFLVRQPDGRYRVVDTKLARHVRVTALLQLAAYHEQLGRMGVAADDHVELRLGDGRAELAHIDEVAPVFRRRTARMHELVAEHRRATGPVQWGDDRYAIDGRCDECAPVAQKADDVIRVAGMLLTQRARLRAVGIRTVAALAQTSTRPDGCEVPERTYARLHLQASLQVQAAEGAIPVEVIDPRAIAALPAPDAGDIFFDFEGDPMYVEPGRADAQRWGLDYLFGWVDSEGAFDCRWAHDQGEERVALRRFLEFVERRRADNPGMHIYHYASYEKAHLLSIAARHGEGEAIIDQWLREGLLVDLYTVVRSAMRIGVESYSIKKLEPLYMGEELRREDGVTNAGDSIAEYVRARAALGEGREADAHQILVDIADYNEYDCISTLRLRDWLRSRPEVQGLVVEARDAAAALDPFDESQLDLDLRALADASDDPRVARAYELAAAAIDFHRRENKSFWWAHFDRLVQPPEDWEGTRGVFTVTSSEVERSWHKEGRQQKLRRILRLRGEWAPGSGTPKPGEGHVLYLEDDAPEVPPDNQPGARVPRSVTILDPAESEDGALRVEELKGNDQEGWSTYPTHVTPGQPPRHRSLVEAIEMWGERVRDAAPAWPADAMASLLLGMPPETSGGLEPMRDADDGVRAVVGSLTRMDRGYLAVQGPPGTGKTYLASHVVSELVRTHRWHVGVVAQSHKVVENVLDAIVTAGMDASLVGKAIPNGESRTHYDGRKFSTIGPNGHATWASDRADVGYVLGGTVWDLTNRGRVAIEQLDLLVIEEAGQYSLANTIAAATSSARVLLLGDPQQLPQVTQGSHPAPVGDSALGHVIDGQAVLPDDFGYFLAESRRMDAAMSDPVSRLSYDGQLASHRETVGRRLDGVTPGLHAVPVEHHGNSNESADEAERVAGIVALHLGLGWIGTAGAAARRLVADDLIVVTPYNAQVERIRHALAAEARRSGHPEIASVQVGTVDKFQGREAVIAIVSLAASSATDVPRGIEFLLSRNRLNVSISRAKWAAYLVHSPALMDHLPTTPAGVSTLSRFIRLIEETVESPSRPSVATPTLRE